MVNNIFRILGRVVNRAGGDGVVGLRVEAWDKDPVFDDMVGSAVTDDGGAFRIEFDEAAFREALLDRRPDLYFKVFQGESLIKSTEDSVLWNAGDGATEVVIEVGPPQAQTQTVRGSVRLADGSPAGGLTVSAFDRDLRSAELLGQSQTNAQGSYLIRYSAPKPRGREKERADLLVKALAADGLTLAASPVWFNAPTLAEVDLTIPAEVLPPPPLFEKLELTLAPLLGELKPEELEQDPQHEDLSFISGETGFDQGVLARFAVAKRLKQPSLPAEFWFALLGGSAFLYDETKSLRDQADALKDSLPSLGALAARKSLVRALNEREISEAAREKTSEWVEAFQQLAARRAVGPSDSPTFVKLALEDAGIKDAGAQELFARLLNEDGTLTRAHFETLEKANAFGEGAAAGLRDSFDDLLTSLRLAELTRGDFTVVKLLKDESGIRRPEEIRALAKKGRDEWVNLIREADAAGRIKVPLEVSNADGQPEPPKVEVYGAMLERRFREAFPTTAFAGGLERALNGGTVGGLRRAEDLGLFLERHEEFELLSTPVEDFLKEDVHPELRPLAEDEEFKQELRAVQRVFKLAPTFEATDALLADDLHSAQQVYRMGESEFVRRYAGRAGFDAEGARLAWSRAADTHAAVLSIVADLKALDAEGLPRSLASGSASVPTFPDLDNLFRAGDMCECEDCRSALSPAAYFADLLMFLRDRWNASHTATVKDVLFRRRPDLGYLELDCDNALTPLPYVDVVCEVLEDVVAAGSNDAELLNVTSIADDSATKTAVAQALTAHDISLGSDFSLSQVDPADPDLWVAHGDAASCLLKKKTTANFFAELLRNTKASAAELRSYPQYVNPKAYDELRKSPYPFALPFDLFGEEVRAAMRKTDLKRWDLMRALRGPAAPNNPTDGDIAAEYFGISADASLSLDEKHIILAAAATDAQQQTAWGEKFNPDWLNAIGNVKNFLRKTGMEYEELLALLDLKFINPAGDIAVHHNDSSCDTEQKVIQVLDATKLDRIHRFIRLWRKLKGWKMWELDLAVRHARVGNGALDEPFLVNLFRFEEVRAKLGGATVEQALALFGWLNTETRFTKLYAKRESGLYQRLFTDRQLINPPDPAFDIAKLSPSGPTTTKIKDHYPVILAALGRSAAEVELLKGMTKASNSSPYVVNDELTLSNLSFLWRHAWLSGILKFRAEDWKTLLIVLRQDVFDFASPKDALDFLEKVEQVTASGFAPDELNWLLTADRSAKAADKEADAARFLSALRKELQAVEAENDPAKYNFLNVSPPTDADALAALLTSLLKKLNRDEAAAQSFVQTLRDELTLEKTVAGLPQGFAFPPAITSAPNDIPIRYEPALYFTGAMTAAQRSVLLTDPALAAVTALPAYQHAIQDLFQKPGQPASASLPAGFTFPASITGAPNDIPIRYEPKLRFKGLMTNAQRTVLLNDPLLAAVTGIAAYQQAVEEFFDGPRLALKFFEPVFTAPLAGLPAALDFAALSDPVLARNISYDSERRLLRYAGILSSEDKAALDKLSSDADYLNAVNSLYTQPGSSGIPAWTLWLQDADLLFPLRDLEHPAADNLAKNLAAAAMKALSYLSKVQSENALVEQASAQLGLTQAVTRRLLTAYTLPPGTLMTYLRSTFAHTSGVVDYATLKTTFDLWFWASRVAALWKKWKLSLADLEKLDNLPAGSKLLAPQDLPPGSPWSLASAEGFLRTSRLLRLRESLPETRVALLEVLLKLNGASYTSADFAADVELLNDAWPATDVKRLVETLDIAYPAGYLSAENWERLRRAFYFLGNLNANADTVESFAAATMGKTEATALKGLLRSKFGAESWLSLSAEIQDALRERKRDSLAAYLLTRSMPTDAPSGKWENPNDLYAYYLLDVEMCACQLTSRLVQASGSVQLFVQRGFMGLEPEVKVQADEPDGDSAWRWWNWMHKYRVWEANRKVFLWPENWIEPELKKDRSQFFRAMENELLQNEINQDTAETAFTNYLEKLDGVAQLEVAGFFQEDDGDDTIVHVFGRTRGAEPHLYYYRRYDFRQWTPWEKVELDIQGDYLIPAVVDKRLFLFWPVFTEIPDEAENTKDVPVPSSGARTAPVKKTSKKLKLQMAVSDYRRGKWTPKLVSKDWVESYKYDAEIVKKNYVFFPIDRSGLDGRFGVKFAGYSQGISDNYLASLSGAFEIAGCKGVPEAANFPGNFLPPFRPEEASTGVDPVFMKWEELTARKDAPENDLTIETLSLLPGEKLPPVPVLAQTPGIFQVIPPWHLSYFDRLWLGGLSVSGLGSHIKRESVGFGMRSSGYSYVNDYSVPTGTWLPFFYNDQRRTFFVLPSLEAGALDGRVSSPVRAGEVAARALLPGRTFDSRALDGGDAPRADGRSYYPEIKRYFRQKDDEVRKEVSEWVKTIDLSSLTRDERREKENILWKAFPQEPPPPYTDEQMKQLMGRVKLLQLQSVLAGQASVLFRQRQFHFKNFYHPFACDFAKLVYNPLQGIPALMQRQTQLKDTGFSFPRTYQPTGWVVGPPNEEFYPKEQVDFAPDGAYSPYNWEIFFHAPLLIANSLSRNQRFEEARNWYHFIFNPLGVESTAPGGAPTSKYWITKPFYETTEPDYVRQRIDILLRMLAGDPAAPATSSQGRRELEAQVRDWRTNPFEPHRIANYRTVAYQKTVVMKYLDNLIAWGDYLFRQDSMESINEATQLFVLAAELLGPRPRKIPPRSKPPLKTFNEMEKEFDAFSNALVKAENLVPPLSGGGAGGTDRAPLPTLYFCIPNNEKLTAYWDTVADRLYKIRNCMNIEGVVRQLALFEPPIDPGALVKAVAGGADLGAALADLGAPLPLYRFSVMLQKANEVCNDVKALGGALLSALEKKDAEALALLRQHQEIRVLEAVRVLREKQIEEAKEQLNGLRKSKAVAEERRNYYRDIQQLTSQEKLHLDKLSESHTLQEAAQGVKLAASIISILPAIDIGASGFGGTPLAKFKLGGLELGQAASLASDVLSFLSMIAGNDAMMASAKAGYDRRWNEWKLQERLADKELIQFDSQIAAAELRVALAEKELENQLLQIENANAVEAFMRSKYTNEELYQWHVGQISGVFFQSYRLAYDLAKRAERCFRFELGLQDSSYISFGYWDSLKKGLLAGEKLQYDLRRLEAAYTEQNRREFELTKHVSLAQLDPLALVMLRETGRCFFSLPEEIFDLDYPGHYFRRIKSVSLTLPSVVGPYTTVSCTLRLLKNGVRVGTANGDNGYPRNTDSRGLPADDGRFVENNIPVKAIAASGAQNDSGVFELGFRDDRYLPFEGAGAISDWSLELFSDLPSNNPDPSNPDFGRPLRQFDYGSVTDAVIHIKYTAREDAGQFKNRAVAHLRDYFARDGATPSLRLLNLRHEFPSQWERFLKPTNPANGNIFEIEMSPNLFPLKDAGKTLKVNTVWVLARCTNAGSYKIILTPPPPASPETLTLSPESRYGGLHYDKKDLSAPGVSIVTTGTPTTWKMKMTRPGGGSLIEDSVKKIMEVEDLLLVLGYEWD